MAILTGVREASKQAWLRLSPYERFERVVSIFLLFLISLIIVFSVALTVVKIANDVRAGMAFLDTEVLQDAFGSILTVVILLEFNHSIFLALRTRTGAIQVRVVVLIAILAIARKLILLDYKSAGPETLLALGGLAVALGLLYWLIAEADRRRRIPQPAVANAGAPPPDSSVPAK
jgi:uncharacterized membrane protein (DUF373 family)